MFNFSFGVVFVLVNLLLFLFCYRFFGRTGLYAWIATMTIIANIQVTKTIEMFGLVMTLGNTAYASIYLCSDLLNEKYGRKEANKAVWFGFFSLIMMTILMQMALVFKPDPSDFAQDAMETIFGLAPRIALGSLTAYFISQFLDVRLYSLIRRKFSGYNQLWIRNNSSTLVSQLVDSFIFTMIAFAGTHPWNIWWEIFLTTYLLKFVISAASTPFIYIARGFKVD